MTKPPLADVPIRCADDLTRRWAAVLDPPIFGARSLWLMWIDPDGLMLPIVVPVDDIPLKADRGMLEGLRRVHIGVAQDQLPRGGSLAMALCRPGTPQVTKDDEAWVESLRGALDGVHVAPLWTLHLAAGGRVTEILPPPQRSRPR
jgi:hypothetical protein